MFLGFLIAIKTAVMVEWMHLFLPNGGHRNRAFFWACHFVIWANITFCVVTLILVNLSCVPYEYTWNRTLPGGYCRINTAYTSLSAGAFAFATDIIILFIPLRIISKLHISRNRKIGVSFVFALGVAACIASIVRLYYTVGRTESADLTYNLSRVQLTAVGEGTAVILVLCVPTWPSAAAALKSSNIMHSLPSWSHLVSSLRNRSSQNSFGIRAQNGTTSHWQSRHNKNNDVYSKIELGAGGDTIPIRQFGSHQQYDLEPAIIRSTDIQTSEEYIAGHEQHRIQSNSQHGWTHG